MEHPESQYPKSRQRGLLVDRVRDETIVYDEERQEAHSLNQPAGFVWSHSDGTRSVRELASLFRKELGVDADDYVVEYALDELSRVHLLDGAAPGDDASLSRRDIVRRLALASATAMALPVVLSVMAPTPAMALSAGSTQNGQGQNNNNQGQNQQ
jgi:hypothetical protein